MEGAGIGVSLSRHENSITRAALLARYTAKRGKSAGNTVSICLGHRA